MKKIITITGVDRVGKRTQARLLADRIGADLFSFPNYSRLSGQLVRAMLTGSELTLERRLIKNSSPLEVYKVNERWKKKDPYIIQCLNMISRLEEQSNILKCLKKNHVVCDRYDIDAEVYGSIEGCSPVWLSSLLSCIKRSDLVIILDGPSFTREEVPDKNESDSNLLRKVREKYLEFSKRPNTFVINTCPGNQEQSIIETHNSIMNIISTYVEV